MESKGNPQSARQRATEAENTACRNNRDFQGKGTKSSYRSDTADGKENLRKTG